MTKKNAAFLPRLIASLIDGLILSLLPLMAVYWLTSADSVTTFTSQLVIAFVLVFLPMGAIAMVYKVVALANYGKTIGKAVVNLQVNDEKGKFLTWKWAFFREVLAKAVSAFLFGLGFWWIIKDKNNRGFHDMLAGTQVGSEKDGQENVGIGVLTIALFVIVYAVLTYMIYTRSTNNQVLIEDFKLVFPFFEN